MTWIWARVGPQGGDFVRLQVLSFAGELLAKAEEQLREGLHVTEVIEGYARALTKVSWVELTRDSL